MAKTRKKLTRAQALSCLHEVRQDVVADEEIAKAALDLVNNYYWASVRSHAADLLKRAKDGEFKSDEECREALEQDVDGNYWVIYTYWARVCILCTNNADAWEDVGSEQPPDPSQQAYFAFMADISAHPDTEEAFSIARGEDE